MRIRGCRPAGRHPTRNQANASGDCTIIISTPLTLSAFAAAALSLLGVSTGMAAGGSTAEAFAKGGAFCFELGGQEDNQFQHFKLVAEPATDAAPFNVVAVHGVERGTSKGLVYANTFAGTATESPATSGTGSALHLTLNGGGNSVRLDGSPEMWLLQYAAELRSDTLAGTIIGYEMETGAIANGKPH